MKSNWTTVRLGEVADVVMGQAPPGDTYNTNGDGLPLIAGAGDFTRDGIAPKKWTTAPTKQCQRGEIVLSIRASIGDKRVADETYCLGRGVAALRAGSLLDGRFLWHWLDHSNAALLSKARGATFLQVNRSDISDLELRLPPFDEQRRISAVLDHVDALRVKRQMVLERIDDGSASIFRELFGRGNFPEVELGELLSRIDSGRSPVCLDRKAHGDEWSVLKLGALSTGVYRDSENKALKPETAPSLAYEVKSGDLLFSRKNTVDLVGITVLVRETAPRRLLPDLIFRLVPAHGDAFDPVYIEALFRTPQQRRRVQELAGGSAASMVNISKKRLMGMPVPAPPIALQREFADMVGHVDAIRRGAERHRAELDVLFASLQSRALAGELDVSKVALPPGA